MVEYVAKRVKFRNGERHSVLSRRGSLPVHEATLYLAKYRKRGRAANTIHAVCMSLALLYRELSNANIDLMGRLRQGEFLSIPEISRLADSAQYRVADLSDNDVGAPEKSKVIDLKRIRMRRKAVLPDIKPVDVATQASRLRYMADYLEFLVMYVGATLSGPQREKLALDSAYALKTFRAQVPQVSKRAKLGAREGLSKEDQDRILEVVHPDSPNNPWDRGFVRKRNWLIVMLLLATGMRRGELLGLCIRDLDQRLPRFRIVRRADADEDPRLIQPNAKTNDREVEVRPAIMRAVWDYINHDRKKIKPARKRPQLIVSDSGDPLSLKSVDKLFAQLREACPGLPVTLTSHVLRHTWGFVA